MSEFHKEDSILPYLKPGSILYFKHNGLSSTEPHPFLLVGMKNSSASLFFVGTSQFDKVKRRVDERNLDPSTLVRINHNSSENQLTKETIIKCNECFEKPVSELSELYNKNELRIKGKASFSELNQVYIGTERSINLTGEEKEIILDFLKDYSE
jgi:hypothetical protein